MVFSKKKWQLFEAKKIQKRAGSFLYVSLLDFCFYYNTQFSKNFSLGFLHLSRVFFLPNNNQTLDYPPHLFFLFFVCLLPTAIHCKKCFSCFFFHFFSFSIDVKLFRQLGTFRGHKKGFAVAGHCHQCTSSTHQRATGRIDERRPFSSVRRCPCS